jgi:hypothetical protein
MVEVDKIEKKIYEYKNIKVKPETYALLLRTQAAYQLEEGKRLSMDDVIKMLLEALPTVNVSFKKTGARKST